MTLFFVFPRRESSEEGGERREQFFLWGQS